MTADYQVLSFQDTASLTEIDVFSSDPLTLDIRGKGFKAVSAVLINGDRSPETIILSPQRLLAEVPRRQKGSQISTVRVLLSRQGMTPQSLITFRSVVPGAKASGFTRLLQSFIRLLFTDPGTDIQHPELGGGLGSLLGTAGDVGTLRAQASLAVKRAEEHLGRLQADSPRLLDAERLQSVKLLSVDYSAATTAVSIKLRITALDGTTFDPVVSV
jgi:hypothetical protein